VLRQLPAVFQIGGPFFKESCMIKFFSDRVTPVAPLDRVLASVRRNPEALQREIGEHVRGSLMVTQEDALQIGSFHKEGALNLLREKAGELQARHQRLAACNFRDDDPRLAKVLLQRSVLAAILTGDSKLVADVTAQLNRWLSDIGLPEMTDALRKDAREAGFKLSN
jgi:hypothetical protein